MSANEASQQANRAEMDPKRLVLIAYLMFAVIVGLFLGNVLALLFARFNLPALTLLEGIPYATPPILLGGVLAVGGAIYCWMNPAIRAVSMDVANELMRVTWPSWEETRISTLAVVTASIIASLILFGIDSLAYKFMVDWLPKFLLWWGAP